MLFLLYLVVLCENSTKCTSFSHKIGKKTSFFNLTSIKKCDILNHAVSKSAIVNQKILTKRGFRISEKHTHLKQFNRNTRCCGDFFRW